jgi:hypothetical protein
MYNSHSQFLTDKLQCPVKEYSFILVVCVDLTIDNLLLSLSYIDGGESFEFLVAEVGSEI